MRCRILCLIFAFALVPAAAVADESPVSMSYIDTKDLKLIYYDSLGYVVPHAVGTFTQALAWQRRMFGWTPSEPTTIVLNDLSDTGNASQRSAPHSRLAFEIAPPSHAFETFPATERLFFLMNHEMVHVAAGDVASEDDQRWRSIFLGKVAPSRQNPETLLYSYLTIPRFNSPRWFNEGAAVFMETWMAGGLGRAQGGYDEMVFRTMVRDNAHFYDPLGLATRAVRVNFQVGVNAYLYGTRFITYLAFAHSPEKVVAWIRRDEGSRRSYADQFEQVFGLPLEKAWQDWIVFEHEFQLRNLAAVRKFPITPLQALPAKAVGSVSRMFYDEANQLLYAGYRYPGVIDHVGALNTRDGKLRQLAEIKRGTLFSVTSLAYDPGGGTLFFVNDNVAYRDLMAVDLKTGEERMLLKDARIGEIVFNPADRSLWGVRQSNGLASLVRIPYPYTSWEEGKPLPYEYVPYDLDISPDGRLLSASVSEINGDQFVRVWTTEQLRNADLKPVSEFRFGQSVPEGFVFSRDGRYLYGSSYYTGVSNIFRYDIAAGAIEAVSNAESGLFRPVPLADGRLLVLNYTGEGFVPAIIDAKPLKDVGAIAFLGAQVAEKHPVVKTWQVPPPGAIDVDKEILARGPYSPLREITRDNAYPVLQGYKNFAGIGYRVNFSDPVQFASVGVTAAWTPSGGLPAEERGHVDITGSYLGWRGSASWNRSDFYDLFGPTKRSRKGYATKLGYDWLLIYDDPRKFEAVFDVAYYDKIDTLPNAQNVETDFTRLVTGLAGLRYSNLRKSLGAVDDEKGLAWSVFAQGSRVNGQITPQILGTLDIGIPLPIPHSALWSRTAAGAADGSHNETVANFYFGGFGNNYVDDKSVQRYREYYSMPGFKLQELSGLNFVKELVEWTVPPVVFESVGTPSFNLTWLRPSIFAAALWTEPTDRALRKSYTSVGAQADLRFTLMHWYDMTLSVGYAVGHQGTQRMGSEWMVSLKIM